MRRAGCRTLVDAHEIAVVGLAEVVTHLPKIYSEFRKLVRAVEQEQPDAAVLIDFPEFNFRLARQLQARAVPVFYYISPQLWAWRPWRVDLVRKYVRKMLVIFPFEEQFYREHGVKVQYVGHPLADLPAPALTREEFARQHGLDATRTWLALLPGSRRKEVAMNLPAMLGAAQLLGSSYDFVLPVASTLNMGWMQHLLRTSRVPVKLAMDARAALAHARAAIVASGTATVEAALMNTPFVTVYRLSALTWMLGRRLVSAPHFAMVNLIAGREVVPELVQADFTPERVAARMREIIPDGATRQQMLAGLAEVRARLRPAAVGASAADRAAAIIAQDICSRMLSR